MKFVVKVLAAVAVFAVAGCQKEAKRAPIRGAWKPTMENPPIRKYPICEKKDLSQMQDDDVIVAVNGVALTKGDLGLALKRYWWDLSLNKMAKPEEKFQKYKIFGKKYVDGFVSTQLFAWEGRRLKLINELTLRNQVEEAVKSVARKYRANLKTLACEMPGGLNALKRSLEDMFWSAAYIASNVPPKVTVTDSMVSNVLAQIDAENKAIASTNEANRLKIIELRDRVVNKGEDFGKIVDTYGVEGLEKGKNGYWDSYQTAMDVPEILLKNVFQLPVGGVSDVLEDDEGYYFVKVLAKTDIPQPTNMAKVVEYDMGRMFLPKEEYVQLAVEKGLKEQMQEQFQNDANNLRRAELLKSAYIVYPYGKKIWGHLKKDLNKKSKAYRKQKRRAMKVKKAMEAGRNPKKVFAEEKKAKAALKKAEKTKKNLKKSSKLAKKKIQKEVSAPKPAAKKEVK